MMSYKSAGLSVVLLLIGVNVPAPASQEELSQEELSQEERRVRKLLVQRRDTLRAVESGIRKMREAGQANLYELLHTSRDRLAIELELAESRGARLEILEHEVEVTRSLERVWEDKYQQGAGRRIDLLRVRAACLGFEIDLAREKTEALRIRRNELVPDHPISYQAILWLSDVNRE